jgi:hypothetical protein
MDPGGMVGVYSSIRTDLTINHRVVPLSQSSEELQAGIYAAPLVNGLAIIHFRIFLAHSISGATV